MIPKVIGVPDAAGRYELLRGGALGTPVAPEHREGLGILLRRGVWAWVRAASGRRDPSPVAAPSAGPLQPDRRHDLARILAGMALSHDSPRSHP